MNTLVFYGPRDFKLEEKSKPAIGDGEILLEVIARGICGTDLKIFENGHHAITYPKL